ncbi:ABC transporter ATP-binding protein/permease [Clostridium felsineum]|uniref:ABC transporter ATP-binding protein n=1 Tax=Clostridium felsineum TaxID=36839 RepID=UPI00214D76C3|nr:ABC transporter ATP-binding protein [Clostridium felsineum]MCR3760592.1 ABC transporter ATP-binding protein/permease [Clostridium felsineum]
MKVDYKNYDNQQLMCRRQFMINNKLNFIATIITQTIFSIVSISVSFLMMITIDAIEYKDISRIKLAVVFIVSILVLYGTFGYVQKVLKNRYIKLGLSNFKDYIFRKILSKSIKEFGTEFTGRIINTFSNDLSSIELHYVDGTLQIIQQTLMFVIALSAMLYLNLILAICVILACVIPITLSLILGRHLVLKERKTSDEGESFVDQVKDLLNGFILIKSFKAEKEVLNLFRKKNLSLEEAKRDRRDTNDSVSLASTFSTILVVTMIFTVGSYFAYKNIMSIGAIIAFIELSQYATGPVEKIFPLLTNKKASLTLIEKISNVISEKEEKDEKISISSVGSSIIMKDVSFSYNTEKTILKGIDLKFEEGKSYAIVGSSGCGKSTLIQLLLGYYYDYKGEILIDGKQLKDINLDSLYDVISVIQQNVFLFDSSIKNNITMFKEFSEDKFNNAVAMAGLSDLISEKGIDYSSGEGGSNLSGGEKQRISIARCLIRETPVIIMDEATAALDNKTSYEVENAILNLKGLTKIIVTHKFNEEIMKKYDKIIVLRDGNIAEMGKFQELMEQKNHFFSLYNVTKI